MLFDAYRSAFAAQNLSFLARMRWFFVFARWQKDMMHVPVSDGTGTFVAIVSSYKRPQNIRPIVQSLLRVPEVKHVVVTNNNPDVRLASWTGDLGNRVTIIDQHLRRSPAFRMHLALRDDASHFLLTDDDVFLLPSQYSTLCQGLLVDSSVPHGFFGQIYDTWLDRMHYGVHDHAGRLDVVSRVAACTYAHVKRYFELAATVDSPSSFEEDLILSFTGYDLPQSHRIGHVLHCLTWDDPSVCRWKTAGFFPTRMKLFARISQKRLKKLPS